MLFLRILCIIFLLYCSIIGEQYIEVHHASNSTTNLNQVEKIVFSEDTLIFTGTTESFILSEVEKITFSDDPVSITILPQNTVVKQNQTFKVMVSDGIIKADILELVKDVNIKIYNVLGKTLVTKNIQPQSKSILLARMNNLSAGTYLIQFSLGNKLETYKINIVR